jgi:DNA polymerase I-like protein with 3'-5' exonuclease and polymerase domains
LKSGPRKGTVIPEEVTKNMKVIRDKVAAAYATKGLPVPMTEPDNEDAKPSVSTSRKTLKDTGEKDLIALAEVGVTGKLLQTYVPVLEGGTSVPINARYNVLLETGRTSCSKPNLQNPPRTGKVRECFVARPGWVFGFADYSGLELATLAQVCLDVLGRSEMAEALRRGEDLHLALGADMLGISYEEAKKRSKAGDQEIKFYRQQAKPANFGFPGGMGPDAFREYSEAYGITLSSAQAQELKDAWFRKWPEMRAYFQWITWLTEQTDPTTGEAKPVAQIRSGRLRGGATYCATANGMFQGLAADGAKEATWLVARECYLERPWEKVPDPTSGKTHSERTPLFGCRPSLFIHDEIGMEIPYPVGGESTASAAVERLSSVMVAAMKRWVPDVPIKAEPVMVRRWYKGAEIVRREDGVILPSKPVIEIGADGKKKTKWVADL